MRAWLKRLWRYAGRKKGVVDATARISTDDSSTLADTINAAISQYSGLPAAYPFELLTTLDHIFAYQPYFQKFLVTTLALGNTGHKLEISAPSEQRAIAALDAANAFAARCFPWAGGMDGLINGLFCQVARTGALCSEAAPDEGITELKRGYLVPVRTIRFKRNADGDLVLCQQQDRKLVELNPVQTVWHVSVPWDGSPYPMPPALAALSAAVKLKKFDDSLDGWLNKLSALGVFLGQVERPSQEIGETNEAYNARCQASLQRLAQATHDNLQQGFALAYDNMEFKFQNTTAGAAGAKDLQELVLQSLFAALQRDPVFFGHNFNTTETFAKVVFEELIGTITTFQLGVKRAVEHFHRLELALRGFGDCGISVRFNPQRSLDAFMHSEADLMASQKVLGELAADVCDKDEARKKLGYDEVAADSAGFVAAFNRDANRYAAIPFKSKQWSGVSAGRQGHRRHQHNTAVPPSSVSVDPNMLNAAKDARNAARTYLFQVRNHLSEAAALGVEAVYEWARTRDIPEEDIFVKEAMDRFLDGAEGSLDAATLETLAKRHLSTIWTWARREDDAVFGIDWDRGSRGTGIGFGLPDETAIDYLGRVDRFYVSKYVSGDEITSRKITDWMREQYLEKGLGRGKENLAAFREQFGEVAERISDHRARVIIDTGVSRAQNWGELYALDDEGFTTFTIAGPWDRLTCDWCKALQGKEFTVRTEVKRINKIIESGDEDISKFTDFVTSRFSGKAGLEELNSLDGPDIQKSGMVSAPVHPQCRHRTIAVVNASASSNRRVRQEPWSLIA